MASLVSAIGNSSFIPIITIYTCNALPKCINIKIFIRESQVKRILHFRERISDNSTVSIIYVAIIIYIFIHDIT